MPSTTCRPAHDRSHRHARPPQRPGRRPAPHVRRRARCASSPVVSNPHVAFGGVLLERLCTALRRAGRAHAGGRRRRARRPRRARWRCSTSAGCIERAVGRRCPTWPRAACRSATSTPRLDRAACCRRSPRRRRRPTWCWCTPARPTWPPVRRAPARLRPLLLGRRPPRQRDPRLRGDEAAGAARRAAGVRPAAGRGAELAARRAHRRRSWPSCADSFLGAVLRDWVAHRPGRRRAPSRRRLARLLRLRGASASAAEPTARAVRRIPRPPRRVHRVTTFLN